MAQFNLDTPIVAATKSGTQLASDLGNWRDAVHSQNSGTIAPTYRVAGSLWYDSTTGQHKEYKVFDGTDWIILANIDTTNNIAYSLVLNPRYQYPLTAGTGTALTLTLSPPITSYVDNHVFTIEPNVTNTGAVTLNVNAIGAKAIRKIVSGADVALEANDILIKGRYTLSYDSAANAAAGAFILVQPALDLPSLSGTVTNTQLPVRLREDASDVTPGTGTTNGFNGTGEGNGWYTAAGGATGNPDATNGYMHHYMKYSSTYGADDAYAVSVGLHYRRYYDAGTWTAWSRIYDTSAEVQSLVDNALITLVFNGLGTYSWALRLGAGYAQNATIAASSLDISGFASNETSPGVDEMHGTNMVTGTGALSGSWRAMSRSMSDSASTRSRSGLWMRYA